MTFDAKTYKTAWARQNYAKNRDKVREYQRQRLRDIRDTWLKENGPCVHCGTWERLEVDHTDPETKLEHRIWTWGEERRLKELSKCQVLCFLCHRAKTSKERGWKEHGVVAYKKGCRCDDCIAAHAKKLRRLAKEG